MDAQATIEEMPQKLRLMARGHGDLCLATWDKDRPETIPSARAAWEENRGRFSMAFRLDGPGNQTAITEFDAEAKEILLVPLVQGG